MSGMSGKATANKLLVIAPHADDAEFGMGGMLHRFRHGAQVGVLIMAHGGYARSDGREVGSAERHREARNALCKLGVKDVWFANAFDENTGLETSYSELVGCISKHVARFDPQEVFVNLPSFNQDHRAVFDAFVTASRPGCMESVTSIYAYEYPGNAWGPAAPQWGKLYVGLTEVDLEAKIAALRAHRSQWDGRKCSHVSPEGARTLATLRGSECGAEYAELLYLMRGAL